jgi:hypothetical protein
MKTRRVPTGWKIVIQGLPLAGAVVTVFLPLQPLGHQFAVLIVLVWIQAFLLFEAFQVRR